MLVCRQQLRAALFTSKDVTRPTLQYIKIDLDGTTWASNGAFAIRLECTPANAEKFPVLEFPEGVHEATEPVLIPAHIAMDVAKRIPKVRKLPHPVLGNAQLVVTERTGYLGTTDLATPAITQFPMCEDSYPDIEAIYADLGDPEAFAPGFDLDLLAIVARYHKEFKGHVGAEFTVRGEMSAASMKWEHDGMKAHALIMPRKKD